MDINDNDYSKVKDILSAYAKWVQNVQNQQDNNNDVRIEPKFEIPSGKPYDGGWCRPQTDGPGLRANAMAMWGKILINNNQTDSARKDILPLVQKDLEWVSANWQQDGCDLWEEVRSNDFFWGRMAYIYSLQTAAEFMTLLGQSDLANQYTTLSNTIKDATKGHWNGTMIYESANRTLDGSVIHAISSFGKYLYGPTSSEAVATVKTYNTAFCKEYKVNQTDNQNNVPGVLYGRYMNDSYAGGNPWQLLSAALAEFFYLSAQTHFENGAQQGLLTKINVEEHKEVLSLLNLESNDVSHSELAQSLLNAGDSVMSRIWKYVKNDDGRVDEQIDRNNGAQKSAKGLTWSWANVLHALHLRKQIVKTFLTNPRLEDI